MKRRLKLTPFAKIIFVLIIIAAARYVYVHQEEIQTGKFFNFNDTLNILKNNPDLKKDVTDPDTVILNYSQKENNILLYINDTVIRIPLEKKSDFVDTFLISNPKSVN